jgi:hypothetical protein
VADHEAVRRAREAPVRDERDGVAEPLADDRGRHVEHLAHPRPAGRALVADHDHVAGPDQPLLHGLEARLFRLEHARGAAVEQPLVSGELDDRTLRGEVPVQDREPARRLERRLDRHHDLLARPFPDGGRDLPQRAAVDVRRTRMDELPLGELARDEGDAAGLVHVGGHEATARLQARDDRRPRGDSVEVGEREREVELARDREQVEDAVRRAACRRDGGDRVLERLARDHLRRPDVAAQEIHGQSPSPLSRVTLRGVERRNAVQPRRADPQELERRRHRVRRELASAGSGAGARDALELVEIVAAHPPDGVGADRLEDVLDRHVASAEAAGRDRAVVEDESRQVEPGEGHDRRWDRLVAADQADEPVEEVAARDELDRVGDHLAGDERGAHAFRPHRHAVGDRDGVELHRRPAGGAHAGLHALGELALVEVARHRLDPRRRDADERAREVVVREADALQHRPRGGTRRAVGERGAPPLGGIGPAVVRVAHRPVSRR